MESLTKGAFVISEEAIASSTLPPEVAHLFNRRTLRVSSGHNTSLPGAGGSGQFSECYLAPANTPSLSKVVTTFRMDIKFLALKVQ